MRTNIPAAPNHRRSLLAQRTLNLNEPLRHNIYLRSQHGSTLYEDFNTLHKRRITRGSVVARLQTPCTTSQAP